MYLRIVGSIPLRSSLALNLHDALQRHLENLLLQESTIKGTKGTTPLSTFPEVRADVDIIVDVIAQC